MLRDVLTTVVTRHSGEEIIVVKTHHDGPANRWAARQIINALRTKLPLEKISNEVAVMYGEPSEHPKVIGTSNSTEAFVESLAPELASYRWQTTKLDW